MSRSGDRGLTVWLTGLPGSGKTTSADYLLHDLEDAGVFSASLDGDALRVGVSADLGFSDADRDENVRRAGEVALLLASQGAVVVVSLVSPRRAAREAVRDRHLEQSITFLEVYVAAPLEVCEARDPKSLYRRAREGSLKHMTGVDDPYEPPLRPDLVLATDTAPPAETGSTLATAVRAIIRSA
jgi:bifunctional enzyme CysN/CysC